MCFIIDFITSYPEGLQKKIVFPYDNFYDIPTFEKRLSEKLDKFCFIIINNSIDNNDDNYNTIIQVEEKDNIAIYHANSSVGCLI